MLLSAGKEDHAWERHELLPVYFAIPTCPKHAACLSRSLPVALPCSSQPSRLKGSKYPQAERTSQLLQHSLTGVSPSRTAWATVTNSGADLSWLPTLPQPWLGPKSYSLSLSHPASSFTVECTHTLSKHCCTLFIHPWEIDLSFF